MCPTKNTPIATDSCTVLWHTELLFFLRSISSLNVLCTSDLLSLYIYDGPEREIHIILSLYLKSLFFFKTTALMLFS